MGHNKNILYCVLDRVLEFSDRTFQERVWLRGEGPEVSDYGECLDDFNTVSESIIKNPKRFNLTEKQQQNFISNISLVK